jgi:dTDP-L-rhamnose 4-epimerase
VRALVTGGAGFIGSHVVDALVTSGHDVRVLDRLSPLAHAERPSYLNPAVDYRWATLTDLDAVREAVAGIDAVCHHAAMVGLGQAFSDIDAYADDNDLGTARLLRALYETSFRGPFVLASSMVVYGEGRYRCPRHGPVSPGPRTPGDAVRTFDPPCPQCGAVLSPQPVTEDIPPEPRSLYAATKLHQEHLCGAFGRERRVGVSILRYHNVYGPRMPAATPYAGVASIFRSALDRGEPPRVHEDGAQLRDFIHVHDVAAATVLALHAAEPGGGAINVATGTPHTVLQLAEALHQAAAPRGPAPVVTGQIRPSDVRHIYGSADRARRDLGFAATIPFATGIADLATALQRVPVSR